MKKEAIRTYSDDIQPTLTNSHYFEFIMKCEILTDLYSYWVGKKSMSLAMYSFFSQTITNFSPSQSMRHSPTCTQTGWGRKLRTYSYSDDILPTLTNSHSFSFITSMQHSPTGPPTWWGRTYLCDVLIVMYKLPFIFVHHKCSNTHRLVLELGEEELTYVMYW